MIQLNLPISSQCSEVILKQAILMHVSSLSPNFFHCSTVVFMIFHAMSHINSSEREREHNEDRERKAEIFIL